MHARDDDVDAAEQLFRSVERAVFEDVDLDAGEDAERRHLLVQLRDDVELLAQPVGRQAVRDRQPGRVVGEREVLVPERARLLGHRADRVAAVGPVGVHVQVALELARAALRPPSLPGVSACSSSFCRYAGVSPASASAITAAVVSPIPGRS